MVIMELVFLILYLKVVDHLEYDTHILQRNTHTIYNIHSLKAHNVITFIVVRYLLQVDLQQ